MGAREDHLQKYEKLRYERDHWKNRLDSSRNELLQQLKRIEEKINWNVEAINRLLKNASWFLEDTSRSAKRNLEAMKYTKILPMITSRDYKVFNKQVYGGSVASNRLTIEHITRSAERNLEAIEHIRRLLADVSQTLKGAGRSAKRNHETVERIGNFREGLNECKREHEILCMEFREAERQHHILCMEFREAERQHHKLLKAWIVRKRERESEGDCSIPPTEFEYEDREIRWHLNRFRCSSQEIDDIFEKISNGLDDLEDSLEDDAVLLEKKTVPLGASGGVIHCGGCSLIFPPHALEELQNVFVKAENKIPFLPVKATDDIPCLTASAEKKAQSMSFRSDDERQDTRVSKGNDAFAGNDFEVITPCLTVDVSNLKKEVTVGLQTWCTPSDEDPDLMVKVLRLSRQGTYEIIYSGRLNDSKLIEFQCNHFSSVFGTIRKLASPSYHIMPVLYFPGNHFVLALLKNPSMIESIGKTAERNWGPPRRDYFTCNNAICYKFLEINCEFYSHSDGIAFQPKQSIVQLSKVVEANQPYSKAFTCNSSETLNEVICKLAIEEDVEVYSIPLKIDKKHDSTKISPTTTPQTPNQTNKHDTSKKDNEISIPSNIDERHESREDKEENSIPIQIDNEYHNTGKLLPATPQTPNPGYNITNYGSGDVNINRQTTAANYADRGAKLNDSSTGAETSVSSTGKGPEIRAQQSNSWCRFL